MPRALRVLLIATLLLPSAMDAAAQEGETAYFESLDGLQRVVARSWGAPALMPSVVSGGTPASGESSGPVLLSIFVFLFDTDDHAAVGWERIDADLQKTREQDRSAPMSEDVPLEGVGDQARGYMGELGGTDRRMTYTFATVQDGPFVYSLTGMFPGDDAASLTRAYAEALVGARVDRMVEQFRPDGTSRGGIWSKLNGVQPGMPDGTLVTDLEIWPIPEGAGQEPAAVTMDDIAFFPGVGNVAGMTYLPGEGAPAGGPSRIDAWIVETSSVEEGSLLIYAVADVLSSPILTLASENSFAGSGEETEVLVAMEGVVTDDAMPEGNASVVVRQVGTTIYAAVVYAPDDTTRRIADNVVEAMIDAPDGDLHARFPDAGDGVLRGLVPAGPLPATPSATPGANAATEIVG